METKPTDSQTTFANAVEIEHDLAAQLLTRVMPVGIDPETPARMVKALGEMTSGYFLNPDEILSKQFESDSDEIVILNGIRFTSVCEHHVLPFVGRAAVGYIPNGTIVGLSKLARVVECYAQRLQVQERLTEQIALAVEKNLDAKAVGVVMQAQHQCMACRGVRQKDAQMITSCIRGNFKDDQRARSEFFALLSLNE